MLGSGFEIEDRATLAELDVKLPEISKGRQIKRSALWSAERSERWALQSGENKTCDRIQVLGRSDDATGSSRISRGKQSGVAEDGEIIADQARIHA